MNEALRTPNHEYFVELRLYADSLTPSEITRYLCLQPTNSSDGRAVRRDGTSVRPFWGYGPLDEDGCPVKWESLEQGLDFLLGCIAPVRTKILEISQSVAGIWWCGHFQTSFDGGPTLSSNVLAEIASYGLPLFIDNYFTPTTETGVSATACRYSNSPCDDSTG